MKFIHGVILDNKGGILDYSPIPTIFKKGDNVIVLKESELEEVVNSKLKLLLVHAYPLEDFHWNVDWLQLVDKCSQCPHITDQIDIRARDGTRHKLYLERKVYSHNPKDYIFLRYVSVDQAEEEGQFPASLKEVTPNPYTQKDHPNIKDHPGQQFLF